VLRASLLHFDNDYDHDDGDGENGRNHRRDGPCSRDDTRFRHCHNPHHPNETTTRKDGDVIGSDCTADSADASSAHASVAAVGVDGKGADNVFADQESGSLRATEGSLFGAVNLRATEVGGCLN